MRQVKSIGGRCNGYVVDISKKEEVYAAAETIRQEIGNVSMIIVKVAEIYLYLHNTFIGNYLVELTFL